MFPTKLLLLSLLLCLLLLLVLRFKLLFLFSCFWYFLSAMAIVGRHCASAWFAHSSYLVIHPPFISVNYLHPIAAEVLIVSLLICIVFSLWLSYINIVTLLFFITYVFILVNRAKSIDFKVWYLQLGNLNWFEIFRVFAVMMLILFTAKFGLFYRTVLI